MWYITLTQTQHRITFFIWIWKTLGKSQCWGVWLNIFIKHLSTELHKTVNFTAFCHPLWKTYIQVCFVYLLHYCFFPTSDFVLIKYSRSCPPPRPVPPGQKKKNLRNAPSRRVWKQVNLLSSHQLRKKPDFRSIHVLQWRLLTTANVKYLLIMWDRGKYDVHSHIKWASWSPAAVL